MVVILCAAAGFFALVSDQLFKPEPVSEEVIARHEAEKTVLIPEFNEEVLLCSNAAKDLYDHNITVTAALEGGNPYRSMPFRYYISGDDGQLLISENPDYSDALSFELSADEEWIDIDNLKTGTQYYFRVIANGKNYDGSFRTAKSTRFVSIEGVENARDIGGYETLDGKTVKQGLLIRGRELDGLVQSKYVMAIDAKDYVRETFGFKYDMDLREANIFQGEYESYLGEDVRHRFYTAPCYGQIFNANYIYSLRETFKDLANPGNYPMYLHCTLGADRTGTIVYLLQGILNMSEEDMIREYRMTAFALEGYDTTPSMDAVINGLQNYAGDTIQAKIVNYLTTEVGVTETEIESIREIFLEE